MFIKSVKTISNSSSLRPYKNSLTCVTCHNPHVSVKVTANEHFNSACKNCRRTSNNELCTEDIGVRNKVMDNCVSCHMPRSGAIDIPHVSIHDHYIRKPVKKEEVERVKKFIGLYAINEKYPSDELKAKAYIQQYDKFDYNPAFLDSASHYLRDKSTNDLQTNFENLVHLYFIKQDYSKILSYVNKLGKEEVLKIKLQTKSWSNEDA